MNEPDALWLSLLAVVAITSLLVVVQSFSRPVGDPRLARAERKLDAIMAQLGIISTDHTDDPVRALVRAGDKIGAIKV